MRIRMVLVIMVLGWNLSAWADDPQVSPMQVSEIQSLEPASQGSAPEYVDPTGKLGIVQFGDGNGNIISREAFIERSHQIEAQFHSKVNGTLKEAQQYMTTAKEGADKEITQGVISGIEKAKRDVSSQHAEVIKQAQTYQPRQTYEKPRVLVSGGNSSSV